MGVYGLSTTLTKEGVRLLRDVATGGGAATGRAPGEDEDEAAGDGGAAAVARGGSGRWSRWPSAREGDARR